MYTDSHAHLSLPGAFGADREAILQAAGEAGVAHLLDLTTRLEEAQGCITFAAAHPQVCAAIGVHPHEASSWTADSPARLREATAGGSVVAVGEIGLDYHYSHSPHAAQREALSAQLALAAELDLPVSIHSREAEDDLLALLHDSDVGAHGGVIHCFTGSERLARECLEMGLHLSFSGIVTFANAARLRAIAATVPEDRLLIETDSPYLAPVPHRGQRNQPAFVVDVARGVAEVRSSTEEAIGALTTENFRRLFLSGGR